MNNGALTLQGACPPRLDPVQVAVSFFASFEIEASTGLVSLRIRAGKKKRSRMESSCALSLTSSFLVSL
jgi:hypothetical protein